MKQDDQAGGDCAECLDAEVISAGEWKRVGIAWSWHLCGQEQRDICLIRRGHWVSGAGVYPLGPKPAAVRNKGFGGAI
jgi:hypothetical protein